jgi:aerobic C4-dicarboxylate transport protein
VVGIAKMGDMKKVGRVGVKALIYFEAVTTLALIIGLAMVHLIAPGKGINVDVSKLDTHGIAQFTSGSAHLSTLDFVMNIIPNSVVDAFARGEILQVLLFSILFGFGLAHMGQKGEKVLHFIDEFTHGMFVAIGYIMKLAPLGAMGAMAFAVSSFGGSTLTGLLKLLFGVYLTAFLFVFLVLGTIAQATNTPLTFGQEMTILGILLLTSKGAAAVAGGGFICLAATLSTVPTLPVAGLALLLGVDWFMATCRALTNMIGNGVATIVVANWEKSLDKNRLKCVLDGDYELEVEQPEEVLVMEPVVGCNKTDA